MRLSVPFLILFFWISTAFTNQPDAQLFYENGIKSLKGKDYIKAIGDFTNAISMRPNFSDAYIYRAKAKNLLAEEAGFVNTESCFDLVSAMRLGNIEAIELLEKTCMGECFNTQTAFAEPDLVFCADFSNKVLSDLPVGSGKLSNVVKINLYNNKLSKVGPSFEPMTALISLDASSNKINVITPSIAKMLMLKELNLNKNYITELPYEFGNLDDLKFLYLRSNLITELPKSIARLKSLEELDLSLNKLTSLPLEMANLKKLKKLILVGNEIPKKNQQIIQALLPNAKIYFE